MKVALGRSVGAGSVWERGGDIDRRHGGGVGGVAKLACPFGCLSTDGWKESASLQPHPAVRLDGDFSMNGLVRCSCAEETCEWHLESGFPFR